jgi:hypothetical protein
MTKTVLRLTFAVLAVVLSLAGTVNLRSANAGLCDVTCGCKPLGGDIVCCTQATITCYTRDVPPQEE